MISASMPSTCGVTWLWVVLSATGRSPEASVGLAVGCSVEHLVVDPLSYAVMSVLLAHGAGPTAAHELLASCEDLGAAHVRRAIRVKTWTGVREYGGRETRSP